MGEIASCSVRVEGSGGGELTVTVRGPRGDVPVRLTGDAVTALVASFTPRNVGPHTLTAHYNNQPISVSNSTNIYEVKSDSYRTTESR